MSPSEYSEYSTPARFPRPRGDEPREGVPCS